MVRLSEILQEPSRSLISPIASDIFEGLVAFQAATHSHSGQWGLARGIPLTVVRIGILFSKVEGSI